MIFSMASCGGCRTCEAACSFRHTGVFIPSRSSIKILEKKDRPGFEVMLVEDANGQNFACDGCKDMGTPLCMQYCEKSEDLEKILKEFLCRVRLRPDKKG